MTYISDYIVYRNELYHWGIKKNHKYIRKYLGPSGKWIYVYDDTQSRSSQSPTSTNKNVGSTLPHSRTKHIVSGTASVYKNTNGTTIFKPKTAAPNSVNPIALTAARQKKISNIAGKTLSVGKKVHTAISKTLNSTPYLKALYDKSVYKTVEKVNIAFANKAKQQGNSNLQTQFLDKAWEASQQVKDAQFYLDSRNKRR